MKSLLGTPPLVSAFLICLEKLATRSTLWIIVEMALYLHALEKTLLYVFMMIPPNQLFVNARTALQEIYQVILIAYFL